MPVPNDLVPVRRKILDPEPGTPVRREIPEPRLPGSEIGMSPRKSGLHRMLDWDQLFSSSYIARRLDVPMEDDDILQVPTSVNR
jgi:hypothetical protein